MFFLPRGLRRRWAARRIEIDDAAWQDLRTSLPLLASLTAQESLRLRELTPQFLGEKAIDPVGGCVLGERERLLIGALACLPILNLSLDYYDSWYSIVVYPGGFVARHEYVDEAGAVHATDAELVGEGWSQGPVIIAWVVEEEAYQLDGFNVLIQELAHKLDMLAEGANDMPPLHAGMSRQAWSRAFMRAYEDLCEKVEGGVETALDPYATESPGEFFAVVSEAFFEIPQLLYGE